ncbi:MAG TPA: hypothetical protein PKC18_19065 [Lacipirellulaceae bacterium]|nr:hypothetical protein [Lacipirellulaceae bacterium]
MACPRRLQIVLVALVATSQLALGCRDGADARPAAAPFATPEACFAAMQEAARDKDIGAMCDCMTADSQRALAGILVAAGSMFKMVAAMTAQADADAQAALDAVVEVMHRHNVTDEAMQRLAADPAAINDPAAVLQLADAVPDARAFIVDMFAAMQESGQGAQFSDQLHDQIEGQLQDVAIDGDQATAVVVTPEGPAPLAFRRSDGQGWKLHISLDDMAARREARGDDLPQ